jgi:hypothetical protein
MIRKCSPYLTSSLMGQVIQSLVFCHLHYCPIIWSAATKSDLNKLQLVQNRAARLVLKCSLRANVLFMHSRLSWLSVKQKLHSSLIMFFRTIILNQSPDYFYKQFLKSINTHNHNTRITSNGYLKPPTPRTNLLKHSYLQMYIILESVTISHSPLTK